METSDSVTKCPGCGRPIDLGVKFCTHCGSPVAVEGTLEEQVLSLRREVSGLRREIAVLGARLDSPSWFGESRGKDGESFEGASVQDPLRSAGENSEDLEGKTEAPAAVQGSAVRPLVGLPPWLLDWERALGTNWLGIVGAIAIAVGIGFFLKLAFDNQWIGEQGRVILGAVVGVVMLGVGAYTRRRYAPWSSAVSGGGIAVLYLAIFAAYSLYEFFGTTPAFILFVLVTMMAAVLALVHQSRTIAIIAIAGGFLTPIMLMDQLPGHWTLLAYILVLDLAVLGLAAVRDWRPLALLGLLGSLGIFGVWAMEVGAYENLLFAQTSLSLIFLVFSGATMLFHGVWRRVPRPLDYVLMLANALAYFSISYVLLWEEFRQWMGLFTLSLGLFHGILGSVAIFQRTKVTELCFVKFGLALGFLTVAIPVQLSSTWTSILWGGEAVLLLWLSFRLNSWPLRVVSAGMFGAASIHVLAFGTTVNLDSVRVVLNERVLSFGGVIAALYGGAYIAWHRIQTLTARERYGVGGMLAMANFLTVWLASAEVITAVDVGIIGGIDDTADQIKSLGLSLLWAVYGIGLVAVGLVKDRNLLRAGGLFLLVATVLKLFLYDSSSLEQGYRVVAFLTLGVILLVGGFLYQRYGEAIKMFLLGKGRVGS